MAAAAASTSGGSGLPGMPGVVPSPGNGNNGGSGSNHGGNLFAIIFWFHEIFNNNFFSPTGCYQQHFICNWSRSPGFERIAAEISNSQKIGPAFK